MRNARGLQMFSYGASLALLIAFSPPNVPRDGDGGAVFAQATGQLGAGQTPTPGPSPQSTTGSGQPPGILVPVSAGFVPGMGGAPEEFGATVIEEGGDIGEGLSNQRRDPDD
ncbi:MAG TPA: hypothetical protein VFH48_04740 [Chloroflexota bacterium]|nr:hypothetical protein [Chloroflexota bacterium]